MLFRARFRPSHREERRQLRSLLHPHGGDAAVDQDHEAMPGEALRAWFPPPAGDGFSLPGLHARRHLGDTWLARYRVRGGRSLMAVRRLADPAIQPKSFAFTVENLDWAKGEIAKYPEGKQASAVIALLWRAQEQAGGWLPQKAIEHVAD